MTVDDLQYKNVRKTLRYCAISRVDYVTMCTLFASLDMLCQLSVINIAVTQIEFHMLKLAKMSGLRQNYDLQFRQL